MEYSVATRTHIGKVRQKNEDSISYDEECNVIIVADGIGGYEGGDVASKIVAENLNYYFGAIKDNINNYNEFLSNYLKLSNFKIIEKQMQELRYCRMGTTATAIHINNDKVHYAHIGDCRILHIRYTECKQITDDHNEAGEMIKLGFADKDNLNLQNKTKLTRFLGQAEEIEIDVGEIAIKENDIIIVATDGLFGKINLADIYNNIIQTKNISKTVDVNKIADELLNYCLSEDGSDNITFAIIYFN